VARKNGDDDEPKIGTFYSKAYMDKKKWSYLPVNIYKGFTYQKELHNDGVVHETRGDDGLYDYEDEKPKKKMPNTKGRFIMIRFSPKTDYLYIGKEAYIMRYDQKRNKIFLQK